MNGAPGKGYRYRLRGPRDRSYSLASWFRCGHAERPPLPTYPWPQNRHAVGPIGSTTVGRVFDSLIGGVAPMFGLGRLCCDLLLEASRDLGAESAIDPLDRLEGKQHSQPAGKDAPFMCDNG